MKFLEAIKGFNYWRGLQVKKGTLDGYDLSLRYFSMFINHMDIEMVKIEDILNWLYKLKEIGLTDSTLGKKAVALRKIFEYFKNRGLNVLDFHLIPQIEERTVAPRVADEEAFKKILSVIPEDTKLYWEIRNRCLFTLHWDLGARIGEMVGINLKDLNLEKNEVVIYTEKSHGNYPYRKLPFYDEAKSNLVRWLEARERLSKEADIDPEALYVGIKGGFKGLGIKGKRLAACAASEIYRKYSNKAGLPYYLNSHSVRHHKGVEMAINGADNSVISSALGHASLQSSYPYTRLYGDQLSDAIKKYSNSANCG
jgi:site-specific recombinase XerD